VNIRPEPCPYNQLAIGREKMINRLQRDLQEHELLRLVTDCFKFFCTERLIPDLKSQHPNVTNGQTLKSWDDCFKLFESDQIEEAAKAIGMTSATYKALHDLRQKRNSSCHMKTISRQDIFSLELKANDFRIFESGIPGGPSYCNAVRHLAGTLLNRNVQNFAPQEHSTLSINLPQ
jgi:hypothetical protein